MFRSDDNTMLIALFAERQVRRNSMDGSRPYAVNLGQIADGPEGIGAVGTAILDDCLSPLRTYPVEAQHRGCRCGVGVDSVGCPAHSLSFRRWLIREFDPRLGRFPSLPDCPPQQQRHHRREIRSGPLQVGLPLV